MQYAKDGSFLNRFESPQAAIDYLGVGTYGELIKKCKQQNRMYYGFQWRFEDDPPPGPFIKRKDLCKPITQFSLDGKEIQTFSSITEASRSLGLKYGELSRGCRGIIDSCGGFTWSFTNKTEEESCA